MAEISRINKAEYSSAFARCALLFVLLFILATLFGAPAEAREADAEHLTTISSGSEIDYPPFCLVDANGRLDGFSVELMRASLAAMNLQVTFLTKPWAGSGSGWVELNRR